MDVPVYLFTGFLDAGKTRFVQETLEDKRFNAGEKTLLLVCEEGEEEYDPSTFSGPNVYIETVEDQDAITEEELEALRGKHKAAPNIYIEVIDQAAISEKELEALRKKHRAERVCVELNGMQTVGDFYAKLPQSWVIYQEIMFADAATFSMYNANMRSLVVDKLGGCEMIVFNRVTEDVDKMELHKIVRAVNRRCDIVYEDPEGNVQYDEIEDLLPFDIEADVIEIGDSDYALWYRDVTEDMKKYSGKTVKFKAQVAHPRKAEKGCFVPGRFVMTCCVDDIQFMGFVCLWDQAEQLKQRDWVEVTAKIALKYHKMYKEMGPVLTALEVVPAEKPQEDVVTF